MLIPNFVQFVYFLPILSPLETNNMDPNLLFVSSSEKVMDANLLFIKSSEKLSQ